MPDHGPTVVLVHGAFANTSSWSKVIPLLKAKGLSVLAVHCPLSSLADDVSSVDRVIRRRGFYPGGGEPTQRYQLSGAYSFTDIP
jgi:pimeloyl-ACP methyl ester carboxylesterase